MNPTTIYRQLRQMTFPPEFRIEVKPCLDYDRNTAAAVREALDLASAVSLQLETQLKRMAEAENKFRQYEAKEQEESRSKAFDPKFACLLCNDLFRLQRNLVQLAREGGQSKELRSIERVVRNVDAALRENGIEYIDLTGKPFDERSEDFESLGQPQEVAGLDFAHIAACERPVVLINGKLVQRARGVVNRPA